PSPPPSPPACSTGWSGRSAPTRRPSSSSPRRELAHEPDDLRGAASSDPPLPWGGLRRPPHGEPRGGQEETEAKRSPQGGHRPWPSRSSSLHPPGATGRRPP